MVERTKRMRARFIAYSQKTKSALIDLGEGENWWPCSDKVQKFISKVKPGEVEVEQEEFAGVIVYISNSIMEKITNPEFQPASKVDWAAKDKSIVAQCMLKGAVELTIAQMKIISDKNGMMDMETELIKNVANCVTAYKSAIELI